MHLSAQMSNPPYNLAQTRRQNRVSPASAHRQHQRSFPDLSGQLSSRHSGFPQATQPSMRSRAQPSPDDPTPASFPTLQMTSVNAISSAGRSPPSNLTGAFTTPGPHSPHASTSSCKPHDQNPEPPPLPYPQRDLVFLAEDRPRRSRRET